jgi:hypothetical protein
MDPVAIRPLRSEIAAMPRSPGEQDALAAVSLLQGAVAKLREAIETRDERAEISALNECDRHFDRLRARRARRAA